MKITYRPTTNADLPELAKLMKAYYKTEKLQFDRQRLICAMRSIISAPALGQLMMIEANAKVIGYYCVTYGFSLEYHGKDCFLDEIYITPSFQDQGIGSKTLKSIASYLKRSGHKALHLAVYNRNARAFGFYQRNGFSVVRASFMTKRLEASKRK